MANTPISNKPTAVKPRAKGLAQHDGGTKLDFLSLLEDAERRDTERALSARGSPHHDHAGSPRRNAQPPLAALPISGLRPSPRGDSFATATASARARGTPRPSPKPTTPRAPRAQRNGSERQHEMPAAIGFAGFGTGSALASARG